MGSNATRTPLRETAELGRELGAKRRWKKLDGERSGGRAGAGAGTHRKPGLSPTRLGLGGPLGGVRPGMSVQTDTRPAEEESVSGQENREGPA